MKEKFIVADWVFEDDLPVLQDPGQVDGGGQTARDRYITWFKNKTKQAAIKVINLMERSPASPSLSTIRYQLLRSSGSTAANYRAACRARSGKEFYAKLCIVVEEADETQLWLELLDESVVSIDKQAVQSLLAEYTEIIKIVTSARQKARQRVS